MGIPLFGRLLGFGPTRIPVDPRPTIPAEVYFQPTGALPTSSEIRTIIVDWIDAHSGPTIGPMLAGRTHDERLQVIVSDRHKDELPRDMVKRFADEASWRAFDAATHKVSLTALEFARPAMLGLWTIVAACRALADSLSGIAVDLRTLRLNPVHPSITRIPDDGFVRVAQHIVLLTSMGEGGGWLTTAGLPKFGLPNLEVSNVPGHLFGPLGHVVNAMAQLLVKQASISQLRAFQENREITEITVGPDVEITLKDVAQAVADDTPPEVTGGEGQARLGLRYPKYVPGTHPFVGIVAPKGVRAERGVWLNDMLRGLMGHASKDPVVAPADEHAMEAAHAQAMATLPSVKERFCAGLPGNQTLYVKYGFATRAEGKEYMWIEVSAWKGNHVKGRLANDPQHRPDLRAGQLVEIRDADVFDWAIAHSDGTMDGNFTSGALSAPPGGP